VVARDCSGIDGHGLNGRVVRPNRQYSNDMRRIEGVFACHRWSRFDRTGREPDRPRARSGADRTCLTVQMTARISESSQNVQVRRNGCAARVRRVCHRACGSITARERFDRSRRPDCRVTCGIEPALLCRHSWKRVDSSSAEAVERRNDLPLSRGGRWRSDSCCNPERPWSRWMCELRHAPLLSESHSMMAFARLRERRR
jgi:hypothetical protein